MFKSEGGLSIRVSDVMDFSLKFTESHLAFSMHQNTETYFSLMKITVNKEMWEMPVSVGWQDTVSR